MWDRVFDKAIDAYTHSYQQDSLLCDTLHMIRILKNMGNIRLHTGDSIESQRLYARALHLAKQRNEEPFILILEKIEDPHNLGSIIRSADIFNAKGIIYKKKSSVSINDTVEKVSTGAINYVPIAEVSNLNNAIKTLKENGYWIVGFEAEGSKELSYIPKDLNLCIVIGSEGEGISHLVKQNCDMLYKIPMQGHGNINSLNASIACAIALYELNR